MVAQQASGTNYHKQTCLHSLINWLATSPPAYKHCHMSSFPLNMQAHTEAIMCRRYGIWWCKKTGCMKTGMT